MWVFVHRNWLQICSPLCSTRVARTTLPSACHSTYTSSLGSSVNQRITVPQLLRSLLPLRLPPTLQRTNKVRSSSIVVAFLKRCVSAQQRSVQSRNVNCRRRRQDEHAATLSYRRLRWCNAALRFQHIRADALVRYTTAATATVRLHI